MTLEHQSTIQFLAGGHSLAIPMTYVTSIFGDVPMSRNDKAIRPYGWMTHQDKEIPIIDLGACLGSRSHVMGAPCQYIVLERDQRSLVLLVERVSNVRKDHGHSFKKLIKPVYHLSHSLILAISQEQPTVFLLDFEGLAHLAGLETQPFPIELPNTSQRVIPLPAKATAMLSFSSSKESHAPRWGLSTGQVAEILKVDSLETLPVLPDYFRGFLWWREEPIPIIDLNLRQGHLEKTALDRVLIARLGDNQGYLGFNCQSDMRLEKDLDGFQPVELDPELHPSFAMGAFEKEQQIVVIPNINAILA